MAIINQYLSTLTYTPATTAGLQKALDTYDPPVSNDDTYFEFSLPFTVSVFGNEYDSVFVNSNGYFTFGAGYTSIPTWIYDLVPNMSRPVIAVAAGDDRIREVWTTNSELSATADEFRLRFVGWYPYDLRGETPTNLAYELTFYRNNPSQIDVSIIAQPVTSNEQELSADTDFVPHLYVSDGFSILASAPNAAERSYRITAEDASYVGLSGLEGKLYNGYYAGNAEFLKTATLEGTTEIKSDFRNVDTIIPDTTWVWTGYLLVPEANYYTFDVSGDHATCVWFGESALEANYSTANVFLSTDNNQFVNGNSKAVYLEEGFVPVRVVWGHPEEPSAGSITIEFRMLQGYNPVDHTYGWDAGASDWTGIAWHGDVGYAQSEFLRVANLHGGVANFLRLRLLGQF